MEYTGKKTNSISIDNAYLSIDELPLYNFDMYRKTRDNNWFLKGYSGKETKISYELIKPIEDKLNDQYYLASQDRSFEILIQKLAKISDMVRKYNAVRALCLRIFKGFGTDEGQQGVRYAFIDELKKHKYKINFIASPEEDYKAITDIYSQNEGVKTQIKIIEDSIKSDGQKSSMTLQKQLLIVSSALQLGYQLNPKKISVSEWLAMGELMKEKSKNN